MPQVMHGEDPEAYLEVFKRMATAVGWDRAKWAYQFSPLLIDKA